MAIFNTKLTNSELQIAKELFGKRYSDNLDKNVVYNTEEQLLLMRVKRMLYNGDIDQAENALFSNIGKIPGENYIYIALEFYADLYERTDEQLKELGFSREEIIQGAQDIKTELGVE